MALYNRDKKRNVIPNFRDINTTMKHGELICLRQKKGISILGYDSLPSLRSAWGKKRDFYTGLNLISCAVVMGELADDEIISAAKVVLNSPLATEDHIDIAKKNLKQIDNHDNLVFPCSSNDLISPTSEAIIRESIRKLKALKLVSPRNPIPYAKLSRLYCLLGQEEQAKKEMIIARYLSPSNRYIIRSLVRLLVHFGDDNQALYYLRKNRDLLKADPWILSAEIATSTKASENSQFVTYAIKSLNNWDDFHITELASSLATKEIQYGSRKSAKKLVKKSLRKPNDNSLAQAEWLKKEFNLSVYEDTETFPCTFFEAQARKSYYQSDWNDALEYAKKWFCDQPFSKTPALIGSEIAGIMLKKLSLAIKFCEAGLISHPNDPALLNNIAYYYALDDNCEKAYQYINRISGNSRIESDTLFCIEATKGLIDFRMKEYDSGRNRYLQVIEKTKKNNIFLHYLAILNYVREEMRSGSIISDKLLAEINSIPDGESGMVDVLKKEIIDRIDRKNHV